MRVGCTELGDTAVSEVWGTFGELIFLECTYFLDVFIFSVHKTRRRESVNGIRISVLSSDSVLTIGASQCAKPPLVTKAVLQGKQSFWSRVTDLVDFHLDAVVYFTEKQVRLTYESIDSVGRVLA